MQRFRWMILAAGLAPALFPAVGRAQDMPVPPGGGGAPANGFNPLLLLGAPGEDRPLIGSAAVQKELKLTDKQKGQVQGLDAMATERRQTIMAQAGPPGTEYHDEMAFAEAMAGVRREYDNTINNKILTKDQKVRLGQLELQREGLTAVARQDIATKIKLAPVQTRKVRAIVEGMRQAQSQQMPTPPVAFPTNGENGFPPGGAPPFDPEQFRAQYNKMRVSKETSKDAAVKLIADVLKPDQKAAFDKLLGEPFDLKAVDPASPTTPPAATAATPAPADQPPAKKDSRAKGKRGAPKGEQP